MWNTVLSLADGEALQFNNGLDYPTQNFTVGYLPAQVPTTDYSAFAASQFYVRSIYDAANPHGFGIIQLVNWVLATFNSAGAPTAKVEIKLPTQTDWVDLGLPYNAAIFPIRSFSLFPGDWAGGPYGCRTSQVGDEFGWTAGVFSTVNSGMMYIIRISLLAPAAPILNRLTEIGW